MSSGIILRIRVHVRIGIHIYNPSHCRVTVLSLEYVMLPSLPMQPLSPSSPLSLLSSLLPTPPSFPPSQLYYSAQLSSA